MGVALKGLRSTLNPKPWFGAGPTKNTYLGLFGASGVVPIVPHYDVCTCIHR